MNKQQYCIFSEKCGRVLLNNMEKHIFKCHRGMFPQQYIQCSDSGFFYAKKTDKYNNHIKNCKRCYKEYIE